MLMNDAGLAKLRVSFGAAFKNAFDGAKPGYAPLCTPVTSDNESELYAWMGQFPALREWIGDRQSKSVAANTYQVPNKTFEATVDVPREKIEDDKYGVYTPMMAEMGLSAAMHPDEIIFGLLKNGASVANAGMACYDGKAFFASDHPWNGSTQSNYDSTAGSIGNLWCLLDTTRPLKPMLFQKRREYAFSSWVSTMAVGGEFVFNKNLFRFGCDGRVAGAYGLWQTAYGSINDLNSTNVQAYFQTMMALKGDGGKPLNIRPNLCVVGPSNWATARALFLVPTLTGGAANPNYGLCDVVQSSYLV